MSSVYETLSAIDVTPYIAEKGGMSYLPWAHAVHLVKSAYPEMRYYFLHSESGRVFSCGNTAMVGTHVEIGDTKQECLLAVMDHRNNAIPMDKINSVHIQKSLQRCLTKNLALHGLGLSLWFKDSQFLDPPEPTTKTRQGSTKRAHPAESTAGPDTAPSPDPAQYPLRDALRTWADSTVALDLTERTMLRAFADDAKNDVPALIEKHTEVAKRRRELNEGPTGSEAAKQALDALFEKHAKELKAKDDVLHQFLVDAYPKRNWPEALMECVYLQIWSLFHKGLPGVDVFRTERTNMEPTFDDV